MVVVVVVVEIRFRATSCVSSLNAPQFIFKYFAEASVKRTTRQGGTSSGSAQSRGRSGVVFVTRLNTARQH
ncbi:hypothetical protein E2C01_084433 [Portunus trituberculatus]|uniref:Uncharacterized protein n=1 Tax=Portunus trituberculatus TaxID=210409 RepID=A0A5B7IZZ0_PORTR|nr:hypothetical protein [Portunus trituberculatus]